MSLPGEEEFLGNIRHHFSGQDQARGVYAKELRVQAGLNLNFHRHEYAHMSILASGKVVFTTGGVVRLLMGPCVVEIPAGEGHGFQAVTDAVWFCIHPTDETDADKVDETLIMKETV